MKPLTPEGEAARAEYKRQFDAELEKHAARDTGWDWPAWADDLPDTTDWDAVARAAIAAVLPTGMNGVDALLRERAAAFEAGRQQGRIEGYQERAREHDAEVRASERKS